MRHCGIFFLQKSSTASERPCKVCFDLQWSSTANILMEKHFKLWDVWLSCAVSLPRSPSRFHVYPPFPSPHTPTHTTIFSLLLRLFHIIVDTDRTASQILSVMNKQKMAGEVTFLPLNKLQPSTPEYPNSKVRRSIRFMYTSIGQSLISDASMEHVTCP